MRNVNGLLLSLIATTLLAHAAPASAQPGSCATRPKSIARALDGKAAYALAKAEATKSSADSALLRMLTPMAGSLDAQGRSSQWMVEFFAPAAKKSHVVYLMKGAMTCTTTAIDGPFAGQPVEETDATIFDTARLVSIAREAGGGAVDPASAVTAALMRSGPDAPAVWTISYVTSQGRPVLTVSIDSRSGVVTSKSPR